MEQHLEDLARAQKKKLSVAQRRAMELEALRPSQDAQTLEPMKGGGMVSGGEAGLRRVVGGKLRGGAYSDSQFGVINEPKSDQLEGGAKYGKMLGEHLMKTKGGAYLGEFMSGMKKCECVKQPSLKEKLDAMKNPKPSVSTKGGAMCGSGTTKGMMRKTARKAFEGGAPTGGAMPTGGKRTLPPALRKRADAMKRLIREEGMTFKEAIAYLKQNPPQ